VTTINSLFQILNSVAKVHALDEVSCDDGGDDSVYIVIHYHFVLIYANLRDCPLEGFLNFTE